jgi:hypothetical protein
LCIGCDRHIDATREIIANIDAVVRAAVVPTDLCGGQYFRRSRNTGVHKARLRTVGIENGLRGKSIRTLGLAITGGCDAIARYLNPAHRWLLAVISLPVLTENLISGPSRKRYSLRKGAPETVVCIHRPRPNIRTERIINTARRSGAARANITTLIQRLNRVTVIAIGIQIDSSLSITIFLTGCCTTLPPISAAVHAICSRWIGRKRNNTNHNIGIFTCTAIGQINVNLISVRHHLRIRSKRSGIYSVALDKVTLLVGSNAVVHSAVPIPRKHFVSNGTGRRWFLNDVPFEFATILPRRYVEIAILWVFKIEVSATLSDTNPLWNAAQNTITRLVGHTNIRKCLACN